MLRRDFETGGFPLSKTAPIICFSENGIFIAYDNASLRSICMNNKIIKAVGVWPGKFTTDGFTISLDHYGKVHPPEGHEQIDNAQDISLLFKGGSFVAATYKIDQTDTSSVNKELADYIIKSGLHHKVIQI